MAEQLPALKGLSRESRDQLLQLLLDHEKQQKKIGAATPPPPPPAVSINDPREHFLPFLRHLWPGFIEGRHHAALAHAFERIINGTLKRLIVTMAPRHGKSECSSVYLPAMYLGRNPTHKIICATHTERLSFSFGRRVRNLIREEEYQEIFPGCQVAKDAKAAGRWSTVQGGEYFAIGAGGALAGRGANLMVIDDPHSEQDVLGGQAGFEKIYDWFLSGPRQRMQPGGAIVIDMTRWSKKDLVGRILAAARNDRQAEQWEVLSLPAILPNGEALFPQFWPQSELENLKRTLPAQRWNAQYQQNPTSDEASIVKREWWKRWDARPPKIEFLIQSWDTSFGEYKKGDPSACVDWGIFRLDRLPGARPGLTAPYALILLDAWQGRLGFPELKQKALELYRLKKPDSLLVEARAAGAPLIQELQRMGLPAVRYAPTCGDGDKLTRMNAVSDLFRSGFVFYVPTPSCQQVIEQFAEAGAGEHDDLSDASVQALMRFREGGWLTLESDNQVTDEDEDRKWSAPAPPAGEAYY